MAKCPKCGAAVLALRDGSNRLIVLDDRIKVYSVVDFAETAYRQAWTGVVRTKLHLGEHGVVCDG